MEGPNQIIARNCTKCFGRGHTRDRWLTQLDSFIEEKRIELSKQDQIIEMLSNLQNGSIMKVTKDSKKIVEKKPEVKVKKKEKKKVAKCDKAKKSLCKGTGGMQLGGSKKKKKTE